MDLLNGMRVFARVVDTGSFAAAAEALDLSGAHVSRLICELEKHLQTRLLQRTTRRLGLTDSGERFLLRCRDILEDVREATAEASGAHLNPRGRLRVHCMSGLGVLITPLIARYSEQYPDVSIELTLSQHNPDPLEEGHDVVISIAHSLPDSALVSQTIGQLFSVCGTGVSGPVRRARASAAVDAASTVASAGFPGGCVVVQGARGRDCDFAG